MSRDSHRPGARFLCALWFALLATLTVSAQDRSGSIAGRVVNPASGSPIAGADVSLVNSDASTRSDLSGAYVLTGVPAGLHELVVTKEGFVPSRVTALRVVAGEVTPADLPLTFSTEETVKLEAYTVSAEVLQSSDIGLLLTRQKSSTISDAIGGEQFGRLAVGDAAEAMSKVTGASLVDGKYVLIRGLGDRYANTLMNGVAVPTADPDKRAVQMDQFPADLIESIVTTKSFTPDQPGAFSGGSVNLETKSFPEQFFFSFSASLEVNSETTGKDMLHAPGLRAVPELPASIPVRTVAELAARQGDFGPARQLDAATRAFGGNSMYPGIRHAQPDASFTAAFGNRHEFGGSGLFGYTVSVTAEREFAHRAGGEANRFIGSAGSVQNRLILSADPTLLSFDPAQAPAGTPPFGVTSSTQIDSRGFFAKMALRPMLDHEFALDLFFNETRDDTVRRGVGEEANNYSGSIFEVHDLLYTERSVGSTQLSGRSLLMGLRELQLDWRVSYSDSTQAQPDYRTLSAVYDASGAFINATGVQPNRFFRDLEETAQEGALDATLPWPTACGREHSFKAGVVFSRNERTYDEQRFQYQGNPNDRAQLESYPSPAGIVAENASSVTFGRVITRLQEPNNYEGEQDIAAAYAMADLQLTERWRTILGVRHERTEMVTTPVRAAGLNPRDAHLDADEALPALSLVYAATPKTNWRFAYGRTIARPTFKELTDIRYEDVFTGDVYIGNPDLELTVIDNVDLRWEWFPRKGETIALSGFYKRLDQPIEVLFQPAVGSIQPQNVDRGTVYGFEAEFRRELNFLGSAFAPFSFGANAALVHSEVAIPAAELALLRSVDPTAADERELLGQSPYVLNLDLTWSQHDWGTTATLSYNLTGERLQLVNYGSLADVFEQPAPLLNFVVSQRLGHRWRVKLALKNLLDPAHESTLETSAGALAWSRHRTGRSFALSLSYLFE
ncbi:MAG TPA: TonB-dependent receptor [Candidatus Synoicihabitans sp.]|nr:TonB-dependent receptor [Candidatus Synoicihabitans sp.]